MSDSVKKHPTFRAIVNLLFWSAIAVAVVFGMYFLSQFNSIARIEFLGLIFEIQVGLLLGLLLVLMAAGGFGFYLMIKAWRLPSEFLKSQKLKDKEGGWRALSSGLVAVAAGDAEGARKHAKNAGVLLDYPHVSALLLAQVAQMDGDGVEARKQFSAMLEHNDTKFMGARGMMTEALRDGQRGEALEYARTAHLAEPSSGWVLRQLVELEAHEGNWKPALDALEMARGTRMMGKNGRKKWVFEKGEAAHHEAAIWVAQAAQAQAEGDAKLALSLAKKALAAEPAFIPGSVMAATLEIELGHKKSSALKRAFSLGTSKSGAEDIIKAGWKANPNAALARLWMEIAPHKIPGQRAEWARKLVAINPSGTPGHLMLGEALLQAKQYDEAEAEFKKAEGIENTRRVYRAKYKLAEARGASDVELRDLLARAAMAAPDPAWICSACGHMSDKWHLFCPDDECGSFNSMEWRIPDTPPMFDDALELSHHGMSDEQIAVVEGRLDDGGDLAEEPEADVIDVDDKGDAVKKQSA